MMINNHNICYILRSRWNKRIGIYVASRSIFRRFSFAKKTQVMKFQGIAWMFPELHDETFIERYPPGSVPSPEVFRTTKTRITSWNNGWESKTYFTQLPSDVPQETLVLSFFMTLSWCPFMITVHTHASSSNIIHILPFLVFSRVFLSTFWTKQTCVYLIIGWQLRFSFSFF